MKDEKNVIISLVKGVYGECLTMGYEQSSGSRRICGPKPWGGGRVLKEFVIPIEEIEKALNIKIEDE